MVSTTTTITKGWATPECSSEDVYLGQEKGRGKTLHFSVFDLSIRY